MMSASKTPAVPIPLSTALWLIMVGGLFRYSLSARSAWLKGRYGERHEIYDFRVLAAETQDEGGNMKRFIS